VTKKQLKNTLRINIHTPVLLDCGNCGESIEDHSAEDLEACADTPWDEWHGPIAKIKGVQLGVLPVCKNCGVRVDEHSLEELQKCLSTLPGASLEQAVE